MSGIIWLASYPKSGNTWMRVFLTNYLRNGEEPADINELETRGISSSRLLFDELSGIEASDLTPDEIDRLRPQVYRKLAVLGEPPILIKVHDAYTLNSDGRPLFPADATQQVIYLIRHPFDVAVSYAHHNGYTVEKGTAALNDDRHGLCTSSRKLTNQLRQRLLTWSEHVHSWVDFSGLPVQVVRYEDMKENPHAMFTRVLRRIGVEVDDERLQRAVEFSSFETLRDQEQQSGFSEKSPKCQSFFRRGSIGAWRDELPDACADELLNKHAEMMHRFGYHAEGYNALPEIDTGPSKKSESIQEVSV